VLLAAFLLHYANRAFVYPLRMRGGKPTPLLVMLMAVVFCFWNGAMQGAYLTRIAPPSTPADLTAPHFLAGMALFVLGMAINWQADDILRNLRRPGETGYRIPRGGAFEWVSGANFAGEILEWSGWALAQPASLPAAAFAFFTFTNIAPRAQQHHEWYLATFPDYPRGRWAVIPFVL
jgi:3-oxo-5-alpha-steroid 4-dehydrogenase 1